MNTICRNSGLFLLVFVTALALSPAIARAAIVTDPNGHVIQPFQAWADLADKRGLPTPDVTVDANSFGCPMLEDTPACVYVNTSNIHLCTIGCDTSRLRHMFWHEMGHVFSFVSYRNVGFAFQRIMRDKRRWRAGVDPPIERFAEAYALCASNPTRLPRQITYGYSYMPSTKQHVQVCEMLQRQQGLPMYSLDSVPNHQDVR